LGVEGALHTLLLRLLLCQQLIVDSGFAAEKVDKATVTAAKEAVKGILKDPGSVRFMNIR
jgi:hypothetical protein